MKWWKLNGVCFDSFLTKRPCRGHFVAYHIQCGHLGGSLPFFIIILISSGYWQKKPNSTASEKRTWGEKMRRPAAWLFDKRPNKFAGLLKFNKTFSKGQIISLANHGILNPSKKWTNKFVFTTTWLVFFRFLEEIEDTKKTFRNDLTLSKWQSDLLIELNVN